MRILIADEDTGRAARLERVLRSAGHQIASARTAAELRGEIAAHDPQACIIDALFGGGPETIAALGETLPFVVSVSAGQEAEALEAIRHGATSVLELPADANRLEDCMAAVRRRRRSTRERMRLRNDENAPLAALAVGSSAAHTRLQERIDRVAATPDTTVLITGERGVRKGLVARAIHVRSARNDGPFVAVDCADGSSMSTRLFGDGDGGEGALTDAAGGTLLLRRVEALPQDDQARLVGTLAERAWRTPDTERPHTLAARVVATTAEDLDAWVTEGRFREDLFYRLNVLTLDVPSLDARREDVPALAAHFLRSFQGSGSAARALSDAALDALVARAWRGNDRELEHLVLCAALFAGDGEVGPEHLEAAGATDPRGEGAQLPLHDRSLRAMEEALIRRVLDDEGGNRSRVARVLGVNRTTLYNKLRRYGL